MKCIQVNFFPHHKLIMMNSYTIKCFKVKKKKKHHYLKYFVTPNTLFYNTAPSNANPKKELNITTFISIGKFKAKQTEFT